MESTNPENNCLKNTRVQDKLPTALGVTHKRSMFDSSDNDNTTTTNSKKLCINKINKSLQLETSSNSNNYLHANVISDYPVHFEVLSRISIPLKFKYLHNHLLYLRHVIYKSLKNCPEMSPNVFSKVSNHLLIFQKFVLSHCNVFFECKQWADVVDYVFIAWEHVCRTPKWYEYRLNVSRRETFCVLMRSCLMALKKLKVSGTYTVQKYEYCVYKLKFLCWTSNDKFLATIQKMEFKYYLG